MKVLVTGSEGYIGSLLTRYLADRGHEVTGLDAGYYDTCDFPYAPFPRAPAVRKDIREVAADDLRGFEAVVHLAELPGDTAGRIRRETMFAVNLEGGLRLARAAREAGVARWLYGSTTSLYPDGGTAPSNEDTPLPPPRTAYAECKARMEREVAEMASDAFSPVSLRIATVFGPSPRMRFDLLLNHLCGVAWTAREIRLSPGPSPIRPLVHILDVCSAFALALEAPREAVHGQILNVGDPRGNVSLRDLAEIVAEVFGGCEVTPPAVAGEAAAGGAIAFGRIARQLKDFRCLHTVRTGASELRNAFERGGLTRAVFESDGFARLRWLAQMQAGGRLDGDLRRTDGATGTPT